MENPDKQVISRVWQRVQAKPQSPETPDLLPLLTGLRQEAALYNALLKSTKGNIYQTLLKQVNSHIACITGMIRLADLSAEKYASPLPGQETMLSMHRRAYRNALGRLTEYEKRTSDPTFGPVFHILAAETRSALRTLTELAAGM
jgi:hypothetical protein